MKACVIATGKIVNVYESCSKDFPWTDETGDKAWKTEELIFLKDTENNPDYWTRLEHQAAIAAMQGMCANPQYPDKSWDAMATDATNAAHALVEKLKEKEERK